MNFENVNGPLLKNNTAAEELETQTLSKEIKFKYETPESREELRLEEKSWDNNDNDGHDSGTTKKYKNDKRKVVFFEANRSSSIHNESSDSQTHKIELSYNQAGNLEEIIYDMSSDGDNDSRLFSEETSGKASFVYSNDRLEKVTIIEDCNTYSEIGDDEDGDYRREIEYVVKYDANGVLEGVTENTYESLNNTKSTRDLAIKDYESNENKSAIEIILEYQFPADYSFLI